MSFVEQLQPYIEELDIEHPITFEARGNDAVVASAFDVEAGEHLLVFPGRYKESDLESFNPARPFLGNCVHELCHLHLAEKIDPSFAGMSVTGEPDKVELFGTAENLVVDIWVNDLFSERFPELFKEHYENYANKTEDFIKNRDWFYLFPPTAPFTLGRSEAEAIRHGYTQINFRRALERASFTSKELRNGTHRKILPYIDRDLMSRFGYKTLDRLWDHIREQRGEENPSTMDDIATVRDYSVDIPAMVYDRAEALELHEEVVNGFAKIGKLPINAILIDDEPRPTWQIT